MNHRVLFNACRQSRAYARNEEARDRRDPLTLERRGAQSSRVPQITPRVEQWAGFSWPRGSLFTHRPRPFRSLVNTRRAFTRSRFTEGIEQ